MQGKYQAGYKGGKYNLVMKSFRKMIKNRTTNFEQ
jgi:hypothetical protein